MDEDFGLENRIIERNQEEVNNIYFIIGVIEDNLLENKERIEIIWFLSCERKELYFLDMFDGKFRIIVVKKFQIKCYFYECYFLK